ncbi:MAG: sulfotransferase domain-containing protein [Candidatus Lokiarchaeota archaeon]
MTTSIIKEILEKEKTVVIVSGLPRSGTSMMMQILEAGGLEILADFKREADEDNPKGYYELEAVKKLDRDNSCLDNAAGKAVKVISHLLKHLPGCNKYKIVFMDRSMKEIIRSQQKMLGKNKDAYPKVIAEAFKKEVKEIKRWIDNKDDIDMLSIHYTDVIKHPRKEIKKIKKFLGIDLNLEDMISVVDPDLYRNKVLED